MNIYVEHNYGADADGNRGITVYEVELDDSVEEKEEIAEMLFDNFIEGTAGTIELELEGIPFEVEIEDYKDELLKLLYEKKEEFEKEEFEEILENI